jgi:glucose uptake protein GlcU
MKLLITILTLVVVAAAGLTSLYFFRDFNYDLSSVLDIVAYLSIVSGIYLLTTQKRKTATH